MKALVLGGNGFIGSHLVDRLLLAGHGVRIFDRNEELYRRPLAGVEYCYADFGNRTLLAEALDGIDIVFHLISTTVPKTSNDDPAFDVMSNVVETIALLEKCVARGIKKVVFLSSGGTVYGAPAALPVSEDSPTNPECSYGITKLTIEKYLALFNHLYGLDYVVVRPSNPYGPRQNLLGIQGAISVFLGRVAARKPIEVWGDGQIVRDYVYVEDLVEGIYRAASRAVVRRAGGRAGVLPSDHRLCRCWSRVGSRSHRVPAWWQFPSLLRESCPAALPDRSGPARRHWRSAHAG